jgi:hypothetical protein
MEWYEKYYRNKVLCWINEVLQGLAYWAGYKSQLYRQ